MFLYIVWKNTKIYVKAEDGWVNQKKGEAFLNKNVQIKWQESSFEDKNKQSPNNKEKANTFIYSIIKGPKQLKLIKLLKLNL